jgi:Tol biopolymer transport system component
VTRRAGAARPARPARDPYGIGPVAGYVGPIAAVIALVVIALVTLTLMNGQVPFRSTPGSGGGQPGGAVRTAAPSSVIIPEPDITFPGTITYAKAGNIWIQTADDVRQLTDSGHDSMPSFSPDGTSIYFVREAESTGRFPTGGNGRRAWYDLSTPSLMRVPADGSGKAERLLLGRYRSGSNTWFYWIRQPVLAPNNRTVALISDGPNPTASGIVLQFFDLQTEKLTKVAVAAGVQLGHQDPAWRGDGKILLFVKNGRSGTKGAPQIMRYTVSSKKSAAVTGPGYLSPAWSPNGKYIAAVRTDSFGTDVVILDAKDGAEVLRVTNDDHSFAPVWSPAGDAISFLHLDGSIVDLHMVMLEGSEGSWTVSPVTPLTNVSGLDAASRPSWFVPVAEMPAATAPPSASGGVSASPSAAP